MNHGPRRLDCGTWLSWLRSEGEALAGSTTEHVVAHAMRRHPQYAHQQDKMAASAREFMFAKKWAECGFPQIIVSDKLFASMAATNIPADLLPDIKMPWDCFVVRVPESLSPIFNFGNGLLLHVDYMTIRQMQDGYALELKPCNMPGASLMFPFVSASELISHDLDICDVAAQDFDASGALIEVDPESDGRNEKQISNPLRRAFIGCLLELANTFSAAHLRTRSVTKRDGRGIPKAWTFQLTRNVRVDCRDRVRDIIQGRKSGNVSVQILVRGHWKNQVYGPGRSERKFIHIEPYWRGPEDAPIAVRSHILAGST